MLGKESYSGTISYFDRASSEYKYFRFPDNDWGNLFGLVSSNEDEMWKVNKKFIDNARAAKNEFFLSHDPFYLDIRRGFYKRELDYIENTLKGEITPVGEDLWKINFKQNGFSRIVL